MLAAFIGASRPQLASPRRDRASGSIKVAAVLAPVEKQHPLPAAQRSLSAALFSVFRGGQRVNEVDRTAMAALEEATNARAEQANAIVGKREKAAKETAPLPDISSFLHPAGLMEARYVRLLSSLSALTYHLDKLTPSNLWRRHRLHLVSTSKVCDLKLREARASPADAVELGDAMAADPGIVAAAQAQIAASAERAASSRAMQAVTRIAPLSSTDMAAAPAGDAAGGSPVDLVAASLASAAAAASSAAQGVYTAAVPYAGPLANNITTFTASVTSALPVQSVASQLQSAAAVGHSSAIATVATVSAAIQSTWSSSNPRSRLPKECQSPAEWFIVDDPTSNTRYFVIQGSDNLDHWRVNLTFDPVTFEDEELGVKVHRGVYETARVLYDRFLPLVQDHLTSSPFAKVVFTGHSLGGSLGTLLMLMYVRRGVLPRSAVSPVYTFGAPAIFCEGSRGACCTAGGQPGGTEPAAEQSTLQCGSSTSSSGLLQALDLPEGAVRNVLMHRDIVPRAFACDYSLVSDLLKRVSDSFREHACLNSNRTVMFDFIGKVMVLQPDAEASFVAGEGQHPLLPPGPGLYVVREPTPFNTVAVTLKRDARFLRQAMNVAISNLPMAAAAATEDAPSAELAPATRKAAKAERRVVTNAREAVWELMNLPHPLDILADPGAYGDLGAISRYHNPDNYTRALGGALQARGAVRLVSKARDTCGMRYFAPLLYPTQAHAVAAATPDGASAVPSSLAAERRPKPGGKQVLRLTLRGGSSPQLA